MEIHGTVFSCAYRAVFSKQKKYDTVFNARTTSCFQKLFPDREEQLSSNHLLSVLPPRLLILSNFSRLFLFVVCIFAIASSYRFIVPLHLNRRRSSAQVPSNIPARRLSTMESTRILLFTVRVTSQTPSII